VPVFFISTGVQLDIRGVFHSGSTLLLVPLFVLGMAVARGLTAGFLLRRGMTTRGAVASGAMQATSLTFPIIVVTIGTSLHFLARSTAAALVTAGLVSVIVFPAVALLLRPWEEQPPATGALDP
jgi:Kef-type K+ transport system membrane component KefB